MAIKKVITCDNCGSEEVLKIEDKKDYLYAMVIVNIVKTGKATKLDLCKFCTDRLLGSAKW